MAATSDEKDPTTLLDDISSTLSQQQVDQESLFNFVERIQHDVAAVRGYLGFIVLLIVLAMILSFCSFMNALTSPHLPTM